MFKISFSIRYIIIVCIIYLSGAMIISPTSAISAANDSLLLCAKTVIPSLFPFIFCSNMFISLGVVKNLSRYLSGIMIPLFGVSGSGALPLIMGIVSGYPVGAVCISSLYSSGECTKHEAERLLSFCNNSGPMFVIGAIGAGMLKNHKVGIFLYIIHIFSALICGIIFKNWGTNTHENTLPPARHSATFKEAAPDLGAAIGKSIDTILIICGFVVIFSVFTAVIPKNSFSDYIHCILEITGGLNKIIFDRTPLCLPLISFFLAFSGISVMAQVSGIVVPSGLSVLPYAVGKLTQGIIAFILTYISINIFPLNIPVSFYAEEYLHPSSTELTFNAITLTVLSFFALRVLSTVANKVRQMNNKY